MPRIRTIKPEFFKNEQIAELDPMYRLLFIGLWTQADRDGKLEDRPKRLKVEIFPYDEFDINLALDSLQTNGLIYRYDILEGENLYKFIKILTFKKHQQPNIKESQSVIPEPINKPIQYQYGASMVQASQERKGTGKEQERKGKEGERRLRFSPPTFLMVYDYFDYKKNETNWPDEKNKFQAKKFIDHYTSNGWMVGKTKMSRWKSAASGWINRDTEFSQKNNFKNDNQQQPEKPGRITEIVDMFEAARRHK